MKALIAFTFGLVVAIGGVVTLEFWCESKLKDKRPRVLDLSQIQRVAELKKLYPDGIFPDPPPSLPSDKLYSGPLFRKVHTTHEFHYLNDPRFHAESHRHLIKGEQGEILADALMTFDKFRRRTVPANENKKSTRFVAFFGDSNINGFGLTPHQTLAHFLGEKNPSVKVYDYSGIGIYPYEIMRRTENIDRTEEIKEKDGVGLYFYFSYHMLRNMGGLHELGQQINSIKKHTVALDEKGEIQVGKTFKEDRPFAYWISPYLKKSSIIRYFDLDYIPHEKDFKIQVAIIKKMRKNLEARGINKFFVVFHPMQFSLLNVQKLLPYLVEEKIPFIYLCHWRLSQLTEGPTTLVYDIHISGEANKVVAEGLNQALGSVLR